jgi:hypothetical protein
MKYVGKYKKALIIAATLIMGLAGLLIWAEREDRIQEGRSPNSLARNNLIGIWQYETAYLSEHDGFARSLSKLKASSRLDFHTISYLPSESDLSTVVYRAVPDRFNWLMLDLNIYTIAIVESNSIRSPVNLICYASSASKAIPKIEVSINKINPILKCSKGSQEVYYP